MNPARVLSILLLALYAPLSPSLVGAQEADGPGRVALLNQLEGHASVQLAGSDAWIDDLVNRPLTSGDRIWIESGARAELHIGSTALRLGPRSALQLVLVDDRVVRVRLTAGSLSVRLRVLDADDRFLVETPAGELELVTPGGYRIDAEDRDPVAHFTVWSGRAFVRGPGVLLDLRSNESLTLDANDDRAQRVADAGTPDRLDLWAEQRDQLEEQARAARYVPRDMVGYEELDAYGDWSDDPQYGAVWIPRYVAADWAPFRFGYWSWVGPWGWTWIDDAPWGFAPCHYGNWVRVRHGWAWSPGRRPERRPVFTAAAVTWFGLAPGRHDDPRRAERVGWAPKGHDRDAGAYTAVTRDTFLAARPIGAHRVRLDNDEIRRAAPVARPPALAPGFNSLGRSVTRERPEGLPDRGVFERRIPQQPQRDAGLPRNADVPRARDFQRGGDAQRAADAQRGADVQGDPRDTLRNAAPVGSGLGNNPPGAGLRQRLPDEVRRATPAPAAVQRDVTPPRPPDPVVEAAPREPVPALRQPGRVGRDEPVREVPRNFEPPQRVEPQRTFEPRRVEPQRVEPQRVEPQRVEPQRAAPPPSYTPPPQPAPVFRAPPPPAPAPATAPAPAPQMRAPPPQPAPQPDSGRGRRGEREQ